MSDVEVIKCEFRYLKWNHFGVQYSLIIHNQKFESIKEYQFDVNDCRNVNEVCGISFKKCDMPLIPLNFPWHQFPNVMVIEIHNSKLNTISKDDFEGLAKENLKEFWLSLNQIEHLPGDLLEGMNKLENVSFYSNKIKYIDAELLPSLMKLKYINFGGNVNINKVFYKESNISVKKEIINAIFDNCQMPEDVREKINLKFAYRKITQKANNIQNENLQLKTKNGELKRENGELKQTVNSWKDSAAAEMENALENEDFKDFTITVNDRKYKVHKFLLIARSPVLAEMIQNNPDASILNLKDIPTDAFEGVLDFLYNDTLPKDGSNMKDIFIASGRLKIEKLKNFAGDKLVDQVNKENAHEMLALSTKYLHKGLRLKAFEETNKILDGDDSEMTADDKENAQKRNNMKRKRETASKTIGKVGRSKRLAK